MKLLTRLLDFIFGPGCEVDPFDAILPALGRTREEQAALDSARARERWP